MMKVLLVDDDPHLLAGLRRALLGKPPQWEVRFAKDGYEALDLLAAEPVDVIISDMRMPGMDGASLLEHVKAESPSTVRIVLSGHSSLDSALKSVAVAHQFLSKPCSVEQIIDVIEQARGFYEQVEVGMRRAVANISSLPSPPHVVDELNIALKSSDIKKVTKLVESDIALSAKLLQLANSAFFADGVVETVRISDAVRRIGMSALSALAFESDFYRPAPVSVAARVDQLERHAQAVSKLAASLIDPPDRSVAETAGLLHDVGVLLLICETPATSARARRSGIPASVLGGWLLTIWGIPESIIEAVHGHSEKPAPFEAEMNAIHAVRIAEAIESHRTPGLTPAVELEPEYPRRFGLDISTL